MPLEGFRQRLLGFPRGFDLFQRLVGAPKSKRHFVTAHVRAGAGDRILDLGCATGAMLEFLPPGIEYVGVDLDPGYIEQAEATRGGRGTFVCADITTYDPQAEFDIVMGYGILHHLDDDGVRAACRVADRAFGSFGRVLFAEPCLIERQSWLERTLMAIDRGRYIRTPERYSELMTELLPAPATDLVTEGYRIPYTLVILEARR